MKKIKKINLFDEKFETLEQSVRNAIENLLSIMPKLIIRKEVIELYPEGADKDRAIKDFQETQKSFICTLGHYDCCLSKLIDYETKHKDEFSQNHFITFLTGHKVVEEYIKILNMKRGLW